MDWFLDGKEILSFLLTHTGFASLVPILNSLLPHLQTFDKYRLIIPCLIVFVLIFVLWLAVKPGMQLIEEYLTSEIEVQDSEIYVGIERILRTETWKARDLVAQFQLVSEEEAKPANQPGKRGNSSRSRMRIVFYPRGAPISLKWKGRWFKIKRTEDRNMNEGRMTRHPKYIISCYGSKTEPIKDFIADAMALLTERRTQFIAVWKPSISQGHHWIKGLQPARKKETMAFDPKKLHHLLEDIKKFLKPETSAFYGKRGIPLRRGYLLHGPPGTGKTSLISVIATELELPIYLVDLAASGITNESLSSMLERLPNQCLVVFDDIDTAVLGGTSKTGERTVTQGGLLTALDGMVATHHRVLFITTNNPDSLDEALIRAGRIDYKLPCPKASGLQAEMHFKIMYQDHDNLESMAAEFGRIVPDGIFSSADIMLFLLGRREEPERALNDVNNWIKERTAETLQTTDLAKLGKRKSSL
ncbi:hypothetical protein ACJZ2D_013311 [Fusarium nematophilum]